MLLYDLGIGIAHENTACGSFFVGASNIAISCAAASPGGLYVIHHPLPLGEWCTSEFPNNAWNVARARSFVMTSCLLKMSTWANYRISPPR